MAAYILAVLLTIAAGVLATFVFVRLEARQADQRLMVACLACLGLYGVVGIPFVMYNLWGCFGPGTCVAVLSPLVALASFVALMRNRSVAARLPAEGVRQPRRLFRAGIILIPVLLLLPACGAGAFGFACDSLNQRQVEEIAQALERYKEDHGAYPDTLDTLVPGYLAKIPSPRCFAAARLSILPSVRIGSIELHTCEDGIVVLTVPSVFLTPFVWRYNLTTNSWWYVIPAETGVCSNLSW